MKYQQHQLDNGLTILAETNPAAYMSAFGFFVKAGSRDETPEIGGVSHFLEHMVFKGTPSRSADQVNRQLDEMGSSSNARTSEESTVYHAAVLPEFQTEMVELLSDLMRPSLRDSDFEMEKQVIIEEIMMYQDQPPYGGHEKIMELFFADHPLGQSVLGTVESVSGLTSERMRQYFERRYSPGNMALVAAGNVEFDRLVEDVSRCCGSWQAHEAERNGGLANYRSGFETLLKSESSQQYILQLAPGPAADDPRRFASRVAAFVMGDDSGSRMYWSLLDTGLAESAGTGTYEYQGSGLSMTYVCCAPEQAQGNLRLLRDLQRKLGQDGITAKELELAKQKICSQILLASERTESRMFSAGAQWLSGQTFLTASEISRLYQNLTLDEVNSVIAEFPLEENMTLAVGPNCDLEPISV